MIGMSYNAYFDSTYRVTSTIEDDALTVGKSENTEWSKIIMKTNDTANGYIVLRSKAQAEHLHFMLGQMLGL